MENIENLLDRRGGENLKSTRDKKGGREETFGNLGAK